MSSLQSNKWTSPYSIISFLIVELLGSGSELRLLIYDPSDAPQSSAPTPAVPTPRRPTPQRAPSELGISDTFDMYVDGLDNIPDSATIVKVFVINFAQHFLFPIHYDDQNLLYVGTCTCR